MAYRIKKRNPPKLPSPHELEKHILNVSAIDLRKTEIDFLKDKLEVFFRGYRISSPVLSVGQILYRGVKWQSKPSCLHQVSYPPLDKVITHQRANRPGQPMFYSSIAREASIFELRPKPGDHIAVSKWKIAKKVIVNNVGYAKHTFDNLGSARSIPIWGYNSALISNASNKLVADFFAAQFTKTVKPGNEHEYKMSAAIAEKHYLGNISSERSFENDYGDTFRFGGLIYPTISMKANADNIALLPQVVDAYVSAVAVEWLRIDSEGPDFSYQVTMLDFANSFSSTGDIEWKGRLPQWKLTPGQQATAIVENGHWVVRNENGDIIEPA
jgi:hypothetical protein